MVSSVSNHNSNYNRNYNRNHISSHSQNVGNTNTRVHRLTNSILLREYTSNVTKKFWDAGIQYVQADENSWNNAVWVAGDYAKYRNKSYNNNGLIQMPALSSAKEMQARRLELMLKQGFRFSPDGTVALHFIVLDMETNQILCSQFLTEDDFHVTSDRLLVNGSFWLTSTDIYVPKYTGVLSVSITELTDEDIDKESGLLYNFVAPSEPLVDKQEMIQSIKASAVIDENFYLNLSLYTNENKSIRQALIDYLGSEPSDVSVNYNIVYGNELFGYRELNVSNSYDNTFIPIKIGLDLSGWDIDDTTTDAQVLTIRVNVDLNYNRNNNMYREIVVSSNVKQVLNPIINNILETQKAISVYPVEVNIENKIEQTVVETNIDRQVIQVLQPMFCEIIKDSIVIENKHIVFENLNQSAYLVISKTRQINEQTLKNDVTVDGRYYFDLSKLIPVSENTTYTIYDEQQRMILGRGAVYTQYTDDVVPSTDLP